MSKSKCSRKAFAQSLAATRRVRPTAKFRPLYRHLIKLARHSFKAGYCQRAGRELAHARKIARYR